MTVLIKNGADVELYGHNALINLTKDARWHIKESIPLESYKAGHALLEQHGMSAVHPSFKERPLLCESALLSDIEVTKFLIEEKEIPASICDSDVRTALHFACLSGYSDPTMEYIQYLIDHGVDPATKDSFGKTAYDYTVENRHKEIADLLSSTL